MNAIRRLEIGDGERRNALTIEDRLALASALREADLDPDTRVVVLRGRGGHFCSGGDVREFARERDWVQAQRYALGVAQEVFKALRLANTVSVACVEGVAAGAGMYLALGCDIVIASDTAVFYPSQLDLGVIPDWGALWLMPRLIGLARAKAILLSGRPVDAVAAHRIGLIAECVPGGELERVVDGYCERIASLPEGAVALTRGGLDEATNMTLPVFLEWEAAAIAATMSRPEHRDRVREFLDSGGNPRRSSSDQEG